MNRLLIYILMLLFLSVTTALAVEKQEKKQATQQEVDKKEVTKQNQGIQSESPKSDNQAQPKKDYDNFVDRNNNGIDDRVESRKKSSGVDKKPVEDKTQSKDTKPRSK